MGQRRDSDLRTYLIFACLLAIDLGFFTSPFVILPAVGVGLDMFPMGERAAGPHRESALNKETLRESQLESSKRRTLVWTLIVNRDGKVRVG